MIRLGLVGCASIAIRRTLPALARVPGLRLVAVASRDPDRARSVAAGHGAEPVTGYRRLLDRDDVDAVYLPLPTGLHHEWAGAALRAGKHVLVEKPATTSPADTAELVALAADRGLVLAENFTFLHHHQHAFVAGLVAAGEIGEPRDLEAGFGIPPLPAHDVRYARELGGGCRFDVGVYPIRLAQLLLGDNLTVHGATGRHDPVTGVDLTGTALLSTPDGVTARLAYGFTHHYRNRYTLWGSAGAITVDWAFTPPEHHRPVIRIDYPDRTVEHTLPPDHQFANSLAAFARAIEQYDPDPGRGAATIATARLVQAIALFCNGTGREAVCHREAS